jgi:hypothetical protein
MSEEGKKSHRPPVLDISLHSSINPTRSNPNEETNEDSTISLNVISAQNEGTLDRLSQKSMNELTENLEGSEIPDEFSLTEVSSSLTPGKRQREKDHKDEKMHAESKRKRKKNNSKYYKNIFGKANLTLSGFFIET